MANQLALMGTSTAAPTWIGITIRFVGSLLQEFYSLLPDPVKAVLKTCLLNLLAVVVKYIYERLASILGRLSLHATIIIEEFVDSLAKTNDLFIAAEAYLPSKMDASISCIAVTKREVDESHQIDFLIGQKFVDTYEGVKYNWKLGTRSVIKQAHDGTPRGLQIAFFELKFKKRYMDFTLNNYIPFVESTVAKPRILQLYRNNPTGSWDPTTFSHPATFGTLALDTGPKREIMKELDWFITRKAYYHKVGRHLKRSYLLNGLPGTGKSSLIASIAYHLRFDVYIMDATEVKSSNMLRKLLAGVAERSILVVEIDYISDTWPWKKGDNGRESASELKISKDSKVNLSSLIEAMDRPLHSSGLQSSGLGSIVVFSSSAEHIDPALLQMLRIDSHFQLAHCTSASFREFVKKFHGLDDHSLFQEIDFLLEEVSVIPATMAELMTEEDSDIALQKILRFLKQKKAERVLL